MTITAGMVLGWLKSFGAPNPEEVHNVTVTPDGHAVLNTVWIFRAPGADPDLPWWDSVGKTYITSIDLVMMDPARALIGLREVGLARGSVNVEEILPWADPGNVANRQPPSPVQSVTAAIATAAAVSFGDAK